MYLASSSYDQFRPSLVCAQESGYPHISSFEVHIRIPVVPPGMVAWNNDREIMVWICSSKIQVVLVGGPGIIDFMNPAVHIPYFPYMVKGMVSWNCYDLVSDWIIPVPELGIHMPVIMVHTVGPGNMDPVRYPVVVIDGTIPDRIVMISFYMILTYCPTVGSGIMLAMLGMGPCNMLAFASIAPNRLIISMTLVSTADSTIVIG